MMKNKKKAITFGISVAALFGLFAVFSSLKESQISQNMAKRWSSDGSEYAQVSVFFPDSSQSYEKREAEDIRNSIEEKLKMDSYKPLNENARVWIDAYSSVMTPVNPSLTDSFTGDQVISQSKINVMGVSGDFFEFHPLDLLSGNYIYSGELRNDRAVLDEKAAWALFSSVDVVGMEFYIGEKKFEVAGVVRPEEKKVTENAYPAQPIMYVHYDVLEELSMNTSLLTYEAVVPDPVNNYARNILLEYYGINTMTADNDKESDPEEDLPIIIIDNTNRYSVEMLYKNIKAFGKNQITSRPIAFPYWENAARITNAWLTLVFLLIIIDAAYILITIIVFIARLYLHRTWHLKDYIEKLIDKYTYKKKTSDYINVDTSELVRKESKYD